MLAEASVLLDLAAVVRASAPARRNDSAPLLARAFAILRTIDRDTGRDDPQTDALEALVRAQVDAYTMRAAATRDEIAAVADALKQGRRWHRRARKGVVARATPTDRARARRRAVRAAAFRIIAVLLGLGMSLLLAELFVRFRTQTSMEQALQEAARRVPPPITEACDVQRKQAELGDIVRPSHAEDVVYELKPNVDTCFYQARMSTSDQGFRSTQHFAIPKPPGVFRIVLLGDSLAFGRGVPVEQIFAPQLQAALERRSGKPVEIVNMSVPGYNTAMEVGGYLAMGPTFQPDCVMVFFCGNDLELPHLMLTKEAYTVHGSYLLGALSPLRRPVNQFSWFQVANLLDPNEQGATRGVPDAYRHMVGFEGYELAMTKLVKAAGGVPVVDIADYGGVTHIASPEKFVAFQRELGIWVPPFLYPIGREFWVNDTDAHPNVKAHALIASRILAALESVNVCLP